ncbi:SNF2-related protein [Candidatus Scalindua japonica]|nr:SNF2-related protein [Candidatus Scalindua japonica]
MSTQYHTKYYAYELTKKCSSHQLEKLSKSIFNATVDLNPHQLDAALFAFRSPLSRGAILADEVGLGKTIEAGLIVSQLWAERKRKILCITPASLRKQWERELSEKFFIESTILESRNFNRSIRDEDINPFDLSNRIVICSYHFARSKSDNIMAIPWDLVIIDEAHRLRNVYKKSNKIAKAIQAAIGNSPKILLTATPLQNSLMELYGLVSFIDSHIFGSTQSFREQYVRSGVAQEAFYENLRDRISPVCQRTLRRQVLEYIQYTNRISITQDFTPTDKEFELYEYVSAYLQRNSTYALPNSQRTLITLVVRKILASSTFAICSTLDKLVNRLENSISESNTYDADILNDEYETIDELKEEWQGDENNIDEARSLSDEEEKTIIRKAIQQEVVELKNYQALARAITVNAKGEALLKALENGFKKLGELNAPQKALIFTESRRTQQYLFNHLKENGYDRQLVLLNGTNTEKESTEIYKSWLKENEGRDCISGSKSVDMRAALVDEFRNHKSIMIATESGAEGLNLQFCNLVVNYDLPWNPQRIEQRIGRCHRYGQEFDVVVINFLNRKNEADQRVFELLSQKLRLFDGVFGASDDILGALESGVDFEKRINAIYQTCRTSEEIKQAFDELQTELDAGIQNRMEDAHIKLMEHFDEDVHKRLKLNQDETKIQIDNFEKWLWELTRYELSDHAEFDDAQYMFHLKDIPTDINSSLISKGNYSLVTQKNSNTEHFYRLGHPLAEQLIEKSKLKELPCREISFNCSNHPKRISVIEQLLNQSGWLKLSVLKVSAIEAEERLLFSGITDDVTILDPDTCKKLFNVPGKTGLETSIPDNIEDKLTSITETLTNVITMEITERNGHYFESEMEKLDKWADDLKFQLEQELKNLDREIKETKKEARKEAELDKKVALHKDAKDLEKKRKDKRRSLFETQDEVDNRKENLISEIEAKLKQSVELDEIFIIRWRVT